MDTELLTAEQVAAKLGVAKGTILRWKSEGIIPAEIHRGNVLRFDIERVRDALRSDSALRVEPHPVRYSQQEWDRLMKQLKRIREGRE